MKKCNALITTMDADYNTTGYSECYHCQRPLGHKGLHHCTARSEDGIKYALVWANDERGKCPNCGERTILGEIIVIDRNTPQQRLVCCHCHPELMQDVEEEPVEEESEEERFKKLEMWARAWERIRVMLKLPWKSGVNFQIPSDTKEKQ